MKVGGIDGWRPCQIIWILFCPYWSPVLETNRTSAVWRLWTGNKEIFPIWRCIRWIYLQTLHICPHSYSSWSFFFFPIIQNTPEEKAVLTWYNSVPLWAQEGLLLWGSRGENRPKKWVQITVEKTNFFLNSTLYLFCRTMYYYYLCNFFCNQQQRGDIPASQRYDFYLS